MLEVFAYGSHVGGHYGEKSCTYCSFVIKVMCTKFGAEIPTSHFGGRVGGHFGGKLHMLFFCNGGYVYKIWCRMTNISFWWPFWENKFTYYSFATTVMCTRFGAERPTFHFSQGRPLEMASTLVAIFGKKVGEKRHLNTRYCVPNLVKKYLTV